jgi:hypothetical protein
MKCYLSDQKGPEITGGEGGIRTQQDLLDSLSYRFHNASVAVNARSAVAPCTLLHAGRVYKCMPLTDSRKAGTEHAEQNVRSDETFAIPVRKQPAILPRLQRSMQAQERRGLQDDRDQPTRAHEEHTHAGDEAIGETEMKASETDRESAVMLDEH